jgi:hypothetical protein
MQQYQMEFNEKKEPNLEDNVHEASSLIKVFLSLSIVCVCICICTCLLRLCASLNACSAGTTISQGSSSALSQRVSSTAAPPVRRPPPLPSPYHCHCPFRPHLLSACAEEQARMLPLHLPPLHRNLFFWLIDLLVRVVEYKDSNKMDHTNLGKYCDRSIGGVLLCHCLHLLRYLCVLTPDSDRFRTPSRQCPQSNASPHANC